MAVRKVPPREEIRDWLQKADKVDLLKLLDYLTDNPVAAILAYQYIVKGVQN